VPYTPLDPSAPKRAQMEHNLALLEQDIAERRTEWRARPAVLEYSPTSACNLRCPMCAQADPRRVVVNTPRDKRTRLWEELLPTTTLYKPFNLTEPLLNDFEEIAPHLARHGVKLDIVTNAMLLTPRRLELILPHLHRVTFSFDSQVKEIFERVRPPAVFEQVDHNIRHAMPHLRRAGVLVRINMVLVRDALAHLEDFVDFVVDEYGIDYVDVLELIPYMPEADAMDPFVDPGPDATGAALARMLARAEKRRLNLDLIVRAPHARSVVFATPPTPPTAAGAYEERHQALRQRHPGFCEQVMQYLKINSDGEAFPCCKAPPELRLGNVFTDGVEGVWNSRAARDLRKWMFRGDYPRPCRSCLFLRFSRSTAGDAERPWLRRLRFLGPELLRRARSAPAEARVALSRLGRALGLPKVLR